MSKQRLINLDDAIEIIETKQRELCPMGRCSRQYVSGTDRERFDEYEEMIEALCVIPTVDAVEVVRCKDCKYHRLYNGEKLCNYWDDYIQTDDTDFCSYGQPKK